MNVPDSDLDKVKKLLRLARNDAAAEGEALNALNAARRLMDKYGLQESEIILNSDEDTLVGKVVITPVSLRKTLNKDELYMAYIVCRVCDTRFYTMRSEHSRSGKAELHFYGLPRNVSISVALYPELMSTMRSMARSRYGSQYGKQHHAYHMGMLHALLQRTDLIQQQREQAARGADKEAATCTAVAIVTNKTLDKFTEALNLTQRKDKPGRVNDTGAYYTGHSDGQNVSLGVNQLKK